MSDVKAKTDSNKKGGAKSPAPSKQILCNELLLDRVKQNGLKKGIYSIGFNPVSRWAKEGNTYKGDLLARQVQLSESDYKKKVIK